LLHDIFLTSFAAKIALHAQNQLEAVMVKFDGRLNFIASFQA
jgi:hypothetical protein